MAAFSKRIPEDNSFNVYAPFVEGDKMECLWINVSSIQDGVVDGMVEDKPTSIQTVKMGDRVRVNVAEILDWNFEKGEGEISTIIGDFGDAALKARGKRQ